MSPAENLAQRILVIDDAKTDRHLLESILLQAGYRVETAENGKEGIALLKRTEFDLVLCDYSMPEATGHEFLQFVRQDEVLKNQIVIMITSDESEETKLKLFNAGANDFVNKGVSHAELIARVKAYLNFRDTASFKATLEAAGYFAYEMNKPLAALITALETLKIKVGPENLEQKRSQELSEIVKNLTAQTSRILTLAKEIQKLGLTKK